MPSKLLFGGDGWEDYTFWQGHDKKTLKRINKLIAETLRTPYSGVGKPEALKHDLQGFWSRRIDQTHRIVYRVEDDYIEIVQCRAHYGD